MDVVIIGAGGHGKAVLDILRAAGTHRVVGFLDADPSLTGTSVGGLPVMGGVNQLHKLRAQKVKGAIVAIGDNRARLSYSRILAEHALEQINAIHPSAILSPTATIGRNVTIAAGAIVTADAVIGDSVILNTGSIVDHECAVGPGAHLCPATALAGRVRVGAGAFLGIGAKVIPCLSVGEFATIGAGAVVIQDVPAGATAVGVPAKVIKTAAHELACAI